MQTDAGTGRIWLRQFGSEEGPGDTGEGRFIDSQYGQECQPRTAADGSLRCLPTAGTFLDLYTDASCTVPIASDEAPLDFCPSRLVPSVVSVRQPGPRVCGQSDSYRSYQVAGTHMGPLYWLIDGTCISADLSAAGVLVYDLGPELPPGAFEAIATSEHYPAW